MCAPIHYRASIVTTCVVKLPFFKVHNRHRDRTVMVLLPAGTSATSERGRERSTASRSHPPSSRPRGPTTPPPPPLTSPRMRRSSRRARSLSAARRSPATSRRTSARSSGRRSTRSSRSACSASALTVSQAVVLTKKLRALVVFTAVLNIIQINCL